VTTCIRYLAPPFDTPHPFITDDNIHFVTAQKSTETAYIPRRNRDKCAGTRAFVRLAPSKRASAAVLLWCQQCGLRTDRPNGWCAVVSLRRRIRIIIIIVYNNSRFADGSHVRPPMIMRHFQSAVALLSQIATVLPIRTWTNWCGYKMQRLLSKKYLELSNLFE